MTVPERHEDDLAEIRALIGELGDRADAIARRLGRLEAADASPAPGASAPTPVIAFVHIPKTAGGTIKNLLAAVYTKPALDNAGNYLNSAAGADRKLTRQPGGWERWVRKGGRVTIGHVPYGMFRRHLPADARYMTFLREPVDRVLSHYYGHIHPFGSVHDARSEQGGNVDVPSLEAALAMGLPQVSNLATRFLCDGPFPTGEVSASALEDAKANLRRFAFVGLKESFEESVVLLENALELDRRPFVNRHVSTDRPELEEIDDEQRALIAEHNGFDLELHRFARELFNEAVASAGPGFPAEVEKLRASSRAFNEEAVTRAREWLEQELPHGATKSKSALFRDARTAGVSVSALQHASKLVEVRRHADEASQPLWSRD